VFKTIIFDPSISIDVLVGDTYTTKKCNLDMGIILIDQEILKQFSITSISSEDYYITIRHSSLTGFQVSNIAITNSFDIFFDREVAFEHLNLNKNVTSDESGRTFIKNNEYLRSFSSSFSVLDAEELGELYTNVILNNKSFPVYVFPYCESSSDETLSESLDSYIFNKKNFLFGGLFLIDTTQSIKNTSFDIFELDFKAKEFV